MVRVKQRVQRTHSLLALFFAAATPVSGEVLVVGDGRFEPYAGATRLVAFSKPSDPVVEAQPRTTARIAPKPEVLRSIQSVALRHSGHPSIRKAGLTTRQWLALFQANIQIESGYNPRALSPVGAYGLGQLMPETARQLGVDRRNMLENLDGSARYLLQMMAKFGSKELALAAYNAGPHAITKHGGIPPYKETQGHVRKVVAVFQTLSDQRSE